MKRITDWLLGTVSFTVSGASLHRCLNKLTKSQIPFWDLDRQDEFTFCFTVPYAMRKQAAKAISSAMCHIDCEKERGAPKMLRNGKKRMVLAAFLISSVILAVVLPKYIWFFEVEGNVTVPAEKIVREVQNCGIPVGTRGRDISTYAVENRVLARIPELSFLTVNQNGSRAKIIVREKTGKQEVFDKKIYRDICACKAGLVTSISVLEGASSVSVGQTVEKGQVLISGLVDLEYKYRLCGADGEVYARTWYSPELLMPKKCERKLKNGKEKRVFYLCFGQKRFKISGGNGLQSLNCEKSTALHALRLPGGLALPVALAEETFRFYDREECNVQHDLAQTVLSDIALQQIRGGMVAGTIQKEQFQLREEGELFRLTGQVECEEMIGREASVGIFKGEIQHDGTSNQRRQTGAFDGDLRVVR